MRSTPHVLLVTDAPRDRGHLDRLLERALEEVGLSSGWAVWDDPYVDWAQARVVAVRDVPDDVRRSADFLGWAGWVGPRLLNGAVAFRWGHDGGRLDDLVRAGVPVTTGGAGVEDAGSVLVLAGRPADPAPDAALPREFARLAVEAVAAAAEATGSALVAVRVALARDDGRLAVRGVDVVAPSLDLEGSPGHAAGYAAAVGGWLSLAGGEC